MSSVSFLLIWRFLKLVSVSMYCKCLFVGIAWLSAKHSGWGTKAFVRLCSLVKLQPVHRAEKSSWIKHLHLSSWVWWFVAHTHTKWVQSVCALGCKTIVHLWLHYFKFYSIIDWSVTRLQLKMCSLFLVTQIVEVFSLRTLGNNALCHSLQDFTELTSVMAVGQSCQRRRSNM